MRNTTIVLLLLSTLAWAQTGLTDPASLAPQQCAWDEDIASQNADENGFPSFGQGRCLKVSPLTVVWLSSIRCQCTVDARVVASWQACDGGLIDGCDSYGFGYSIAGVSSGSGTGLMGEADASTTISGFAPPVIFFDEMMDVDCGATFLFDFSVSCSCTRTIETVDVIFEVDVDTDSISVVEVVTVERQVVCGPHTETLANFVALCNQECDPSNPPDDIPIE